MSSRKHGEGPANSSTRTTVGEQPVRRRRPLAVAVIEMTCCWEDGATPTWMSDQLGIRIPERASDRRAGYKVGQRYDTGLLSFVLPSEEAETYTGRLIEKDTVMIENSHPKEKGYRPAAAFGHLGLPEPEAFVQGLRKASLCPDDLASPEGKYLQRCIDLFAHEFTPGTTRIYVRSTIEPSVAPPPAGQAS
ncbi:hypothetical protein [Streptomyces sp. CS147]|uniref:hypothetical protein n=1 Tax=Streptomyces sp. CS147 TaxID=2162715 RepID=UPI000D506C68|nr:hypothetical protein [Streptomyces sp. CS147]PVC97259.1 hypothetical protein DBP21_25790 [Streptomyces sp. CS147]